MQKFYMFLPHLITYLHDRILLANRRFDRATEVRRVLKLRENVLHFCHFPMNLAKYCLNSSTIVVNK